MTAVMQTFEDIFVAFGGPKRFAAALGIKHFHAGTMKTRGSIPPAYWADLVSAAHEHGIEGVTLEALAEMAKAKRPEGQTGPASERESAA